MERVNESGGRERVCLREREREREREERGEREREREREREKYTYKKGFSVIAYI